MSNSDQLSAAERNVIIIATRCSQDFQFVARTLSMRNAKEAQEVFQSARRKLLQQAYDKPQPGQVTVSAMAKTLQVDHYWVVKNVQQFTNLAAHRDAGNGRIVPYYPPQVLEALRTIRQTAYGEPGSGWATITTMRQLLGTDWNWVDRRIGPYRHLAARRRGKGGQSCSHYPPEVISAMRTLREAQKACPEAGDHLNATQLQEQLGKSWAWITKTLESLGFVPEPRRDRMQKVVKHYPPEVLPFLKEIATEFPTSGRWMTINQLAIRLKMDREWVERQLQGNGFIGEIRCMSGYGKPAMHYPPKALSVLRPLAQQHPPADGWLTVNALATLTETSTGWVERQLRGMDTEEQTRKDAQGVPRLHHPPETLDELLKRKIVLGKLQSRQAAGLQFRLSIMNVLAEATEPITLPGVQRGLEAGYGKKRVYDGLIWLKQHNLVTRTRRTPGVKKTRWQLTENGRSALAIQT